LEIPNIIALYYTASFSLLMLKVVRSEWRLRQTRRKYKCKEE